MSRGEGGAYRSNTPPICHADLHVPRRGCSGGETVTGDGWEGVEGCLVIVKVNSVQ